MSCHTHELIIIQTNVTIEKEKTPPLYMSGVTLHVTHMTCHTHELIITYDVSHSRTHYHICRVTLDVTLYVTYMYQLCHKHS